MYSVTITGNTPSELNDNIAKYVSNRNELLAGVSATATAVLSASDQARLRGDATVVPPKEDAKAETAKGPTAAEKKAAEKAAKEAAAAAKAEADAAAAKAAEDEALGDGDADDSEALTHDDVKKLLLEVRAKYPKQATIVSEIVKDYGKVAAISKVDAKDLPAVAARCRELLAA